MVLAGDRGVPGRLPRLGLIGAPLNGTTRVSRTSWTPVRGIAPSGPWSLGRVILSAAFSSSVMTGGLLLPLPCDGAVPTAFGSSMCNQDPVVSDRPLLCVNTCPEFSVPSENCRVLDCPAELGIMELPAEEVIFPWFAVQARSRFCSWLKTLRLIT